jgi:hypothetical protein
MIRDLHPQIPPDITRNQNLLLLNHIELGNPVKVTGYKENKIILQTRLNHKFTHIPEVKTETNNF